MNFIGIALFVGLAAWDANRIKNIGAQVGSHPAKGGLVVIGALFGFHQLVPTNVAS